MPSPFPGMDPYLEGSLWITVHTQLSAEIARQLAPKVRPRYLALTTERFVLTSPESVAIATATLYPDVSLTESRPGSPLMGGSALSTAPLRLATAMPEVVPHVTVEIRDAASRRLVTAIEVLSPVNKRGDGREEYLSKRNRLLNSSAHLLEIDLLREGSRVPMRQALPPASYFVLLSRAEARPLTDVWPITIRQPLPTVPAPLLEGDPDVSLDLQLAFANVYDLCGYDLAVNYAGQPEIQLEPGDAAWAVQRVRGR